MLSRKRLIMGGAVALSLVLIAVGAQGQSRRREAPASGASSQGGDKTVLDLASPWRLHTSLKPPLVREGAGVKPLAMSQRWMMWESPEPPADWAQTDFDDGSWLRGPASRGGASPRVARLCLRGRFVVADPARAGGLKLSVAYHGGAIVYVNGKELKRGDVAPGAARTAKEYPETAFVTREGGYLAPANAYLGGKPGYKPDADAQERMKQWRREMTDGG